MSQHNKWDWVVFCLSFGGYIPLGMGGWQHPVEINVASYSIWLLLTVMMFYSSIAQGFAGWRLPFAWMIGNISILVLACFLEGWTFDLGPVESVALYGVISVVGAWITIGGITGKRNPRILFLGSIMVDILSFYPQLKQYLLPHDPPTNWLLLGWGMMLAGAIVNVLFVEGFFARIWASGTEYRDTYRKEKKFWSIVEESALSLENSILMMTTIFVMTRH